MRGIGFYDSEFFVIKKDHDLVAESIRRIIMTNSKERLGHPFFGGNLKAALFELKDETELEEIKSNMKLQLEQYEPRAAISQIKFGTSDENENGVELIIGFILVGDPKQDERILSITIES